MTRPTIATSAACENQALNEILGDIPTSGLQLIGDIDKEYTGDGTQPAFTAAQL